MYSDEEDVVAEVPDSVIVESQQISSRGKGGASMVESREVNIFEDSGFDTDLETERKSVV